MLTSLQHQVAGHAGGVQTLASGEWVVKDCLERELAFYRELITATEQRELLDRLLPFVPKCKGRWQSASEDAHPRIVLENLTHAYHKPNVCDIKLGTQLWDEDATEDKRKRMDLVSQSTTSGEYGIRFTGWQVYDNQHKRFHTVSKTFGKTISGTLQLELGLRMLLACPQPHDAIQADAVLPDTSLSSQQQPYIPTLPSKDVVHVLQDHLLPSVDALVDIFTHLEVRMRGASLLLVYEGESSTTPPKTDVRLIDFGHATLVPGQGPDQGVLLGLRTLSSLLKQQLARLQRQ